MSYSLTLIDSAGKMCGSFYRLSKELGMAESTISQIRSGKRPLPVDVVPMLAVMARIDVDEAIHAVLIEQSAGTKRETALRVALGKGLAAGVGAMSVFSYSGNSNASTENQQTVSPTIDHKSY
jgi:hypothetical protein